MRTNRSVEVCAERAESPRRRRGEAKVRRLQIARMMATRLQRIREPTDCAPSSPLSRAALEIVGQQASPARAQRGAHLPYEMIVGEEDVWRAPACQYPTCQAATRAGRNGLSELMVSTDSRQSFDEPTWERAGYSFLASPLEFRLLLRRRILFLRRRMPVRKQPLHRRL